MPEPVESFLRAVMAVEHARPDSVAERILYLRMHDVIKQRAQEIQRSMRTAAQHYSSRKGGLRYTPGRPLDVSGSSVSTSDPFSESGLGREPLLDA